MTLCTVISEGSMVAAATKLTLSQPAVRHHILEMEKELGVNIFIRGVRGFRLTVQGQLFYNYARKMLNITQSMKESVQNMSDNLEGSVRIATLNSIGLNLITPIVGSVLRPSRRKLRMGISYGTGQEVIARMRAKKVDIAILPDLKKEYGVELPYYESQLLFKDELLFVGSGKDGSLPKSISVKDLGLRPLVVFQNLYPQFQYRWEQMVREQKLTVSPVFESNNVGTLKRLIESWMCWGYLPAHSIQKQIRMNRLCVIELKELVYSMNIHAYYLSGQPEKKAIIDTFLMMLQKQYDFI